jgi:DNA replication protein DnaC
MNSAFGLNSAFGGNRKNIDIMNASPVCEHVTRSTDEMPTDWRLVPCKCIGCGAEFTSKIDIALMKSMGLAFLPNGCDECAKKQARKERVVSECEEMKSDVPFHVYDPELGNNVTFNKIYRALERSESVYILGDTGAGKTRSLAYHALDSLSRGISVKWCDCSKLMDELSSAERNGETEIVKTRLLRCRVLVLDDLGKGKATEHRSAAIFDIMDRIVKSEGRVRLWITSNKDPEQIAQFFGDYGRGIAQRLSDTCELVDLGRAE